MSQEAGKRLIVNADDFGWSSGVNQGILEAHEKGLVTSATLMVNQPGAEDAAARSGDRPGLGVGLHLVFTGGGRPTLPAAEVASLVGDEGRLPRRPEGIASPDSREVRAEVLAQLRRFEELMGRPPTHLDSHHHSHRHPVIGGVVAEVAAERGLPVRQGDDRLASRLAEAGVLTTDAFVESFFGDGVGIEELVTILDALGPGVTEVMCHPGRVDAELAASSTYREARETEIEVLCAPRVRLALVESGAELIHFGALGSRR